MKYFITQVLIAALLPSLALSAPLIPRVDAVVTAAKDWKADTTKVSTFLNNAPKLSGKALTAAAAAAHTHELNELVHKKVIDAKFLKTNTVIKSANNVLVTEAKFDTVVSGLASLATDGAASFSKEKIQVIVNSINLNRCTNVLPAIDKYFKVADPGAGLKATRPTECTLTGLN